MDADALDAMCVDDDGNARWYVYAPASGEMWAQEHLDRDTLLAAWQRGYRLLTWPPLLDAHEATMRRQLQRGARWN